VKNITMEILFTIKSWLLIQRTIFLITTPPNCTTKVRALRKENVLTAGAVGTSCTLFKRNGKNMERKNDVINQSPKIYYWTER
jgi:hypothetical protein